MWNSKKSFKMHWFMGRYQLPNRGGSLCTWGGGAAFTDELVTLFGKLSIKS